MTHRTTKGRVVYERKVHLWKLRDLLRIAGHVDPGPEETTESLLAGCEVLLLLVSKMAILALERAPGALGLPGRILALVVVPVIDVLRWVQAWAGSLLRGLIDWLKGVLGTL